MGQLAPQLLIRLSVEVLGRDPRRIGSGVLTQMFTDALPGCLLLPDALLDELPAVITGYYTWIAEQHLPKADRKEMLRILRRHTAALPGLLGLSIPAAAVRPYSGVGDSAPTLIRGVPMPNYIALTYTPDVDWTRLAVLHEVGRRSASSGAATR